MVQSVDIFPPVVDDPYEYGQIAAANSLSDLYAMGAEPSLCMNIFCFPEDMPNDILQAILQGGYEKVIEAEAIIAGGHTIKDHEPKYGLCVTGFAHPDEILKNCDAKTGDLLILTKPIGTGILNTAAKAGLTEDSTNRAMVNAMTQLNKYAYRVMKRYPVHACTDVTGFGLLGHTYEMAEGSGKTIEIFSSAISILPEAEEFAKEGIIPAGAYDNRNYLKNLVEEQPGISLSKMDLLYDPQTSGGLLIALEEKEAEKLVRDLKNETPWAEIIGQVEAPKDHRISVRP